MISKKSLVTRAENSNLNSKELDHFAELELERELEKIFFSELELASQCSSSLERYLNR